MSGTTTFTPNAFSLFSFQATLDGTLYNVITTWNVYRQDWYVNIYDQSNTLIVARPLVGSPPPSTPGVNLAAPWFTASSMYFYEQAQTFVVTP